jgi:hypothetical protein
VNDSPQFQNVEQIRAESEPALHLKGIEGIAGLAYLLHQGISIAAHQNRLMASAPELFIQRKAVRYLANPLASAVNDENLEGFHRHVMQKIMIEFTRPLHYIYSGLLLIKTFPLIFATEGVLIFYLGLSKELQRKRWRLSRSTIKYQNMDQIGQKKGVQLKDAKPQKS